MLPYFLRAMFFRGSLFNVLREWHTKGDPHTQSDEEAPGSPVGKLECLQRKSTGEIQKAI